jgi:hypothetical protein
MGPVLATPPQPVCGYFVIVRTSSLARIRPGARNHAQTFFGNTLGPPGPAGHVRHHSWSALSAGERSLGSPGRPVKGGGRLYGRRGQQQEVALDDCFGDA